MGTYRTYRIDGYRARVYPSGKTTVYQGRRRVGIWWVSVPSYVVGLLGDSAEECARVAIDAAKERRSA